MEKYIKAVILFLFFIFIFALPVKASVTAPPPDISVPVRQFVQDRILRKEQLLNQIELHKELLTSQKSQVHEEAQEQKRVRISTKEAEMSDAYKQRAREGFGKLVTRFGVAINRLEILIERIEARLADIKEEDPDLDTTKIEKDLATAHSLLLDARLDLEAASESFDDILDSEDPKATFQIIKDSVMEIKDRLIEVHKLLVSIIKDIKGLRVGNTSETQI